MAVGRVLPFVSPLMTLVEAAIVGLVFLLSLIIVRELTGNDLRMVLSVVKKEKK